MPAWLALPFPAINISTLKAAEARQSTLTKPPGSLGYLEQIAIQFAGWQGTITPALVGNKTSIVIFAADHGVTEEGVSAFPQAVTVEMVKNFSRGGAAISVLADHHGAALHIVNVGTAHSVKGVPGVIDLSIAEGTANFTQQAAMSEQDCSKALLAGQQTVNQVVADGTLLFIGGEMGIGNTTSATAICCALMGRKVDELVGAGTGLDQPAIDRKATVIAAALLKHQHCKDPLEVLRAVGGFEIAALVGAYIAAAQRGIPSLVDGFIATTAALVACRVRPDIKAWLIFSHQSAERGHRLVLEHLGVRPVLSLDLRLGEASGAAVCLPIIDSALALHERMATFQEAEVQGAL